MRSLVAALLASASLLAAGPAAAQFSWTMASAPGGAPSPPSTNGFYALPQAAYSCSTNYYVNAATGNDSRTSTQAQSSSTPWLTIGKATTGSSVFGPGTCVNVAPGTYAEDVTMANSSGTAGNANSATGNAVLRCSTAATPWLAYWTLGISGSNPSCLITTASDSPYAIVDFPHTSAYSILDGFDITQPFQGSQSVSAFAYNSTTGVVTLTLGGGAEVCPQTGFSVAGLTGTGSISIANGYFFAGAGTACSGSAPATATTVTYTVATGLTMVYVTGGTLSYGVGATYGVGTDIGNPNPGGHHYSVLNSRIHDTPGAGADWLFADDIFMVGNVIFNTAWGNGNDTSGISLVENTAQTGTGAFDGTYGSVSGVLVRNVLANNVTEHNGNLYAPFSDGNGIIVDTMNGTQSSCTPTYSFGTLLYGNVSYLNGGKGLHTFFSSHTATINNTSYSNNWDILNSSATQRADLDEVCGNGNIVQNNIAVATAGSVNKQPDNIAAGSYDLGGSTFGVGGLWNNNILDGNGSFGCFNIGSSGLAGVTCYNGVASILKTNPSAWASGTSYSQSALVLGSDGNTYASLVNSNAGNNPISSPTKWQNNGLANNSYPTDPLFTSTSLPNFVLQSGSPALGASTSAVTALGGPSVATPNIGAY